MITHPVRAEQVDTKPGIRMLIPVTGYGHRLQFPQFFQPQIEAACHRQISRPNLDSLTYI